jgi:hypothetical protein
VKILLDECTPHIVKLPTNQVPIVASLIPEIEATLATINPGDFVEIAMPMS